MTSLSFSAALGSCLPLHVEFNVARPGRRNYSVSPAGSGRYPYSGQHPPPSTQSPTPEPCSKSGNNAPIEKKTALAAEPCCASDSKSLMEFQCHTTTPQGWPELKGNSNRLKMLDSGSNLVHRLTDPNECHPATLVRLIHSRSCSGPSLFEANTK